MTSLIYRRVLTLVEDAFQLAMSVGIPNLLQPGLVKEMIIADILGHVLILSKRDSDACDPANSDLRFEYLTCKEGGSGQFDRMFKQPLDKRVQSLERITRNKLIYLAVFYKDNQIRVKEIYELNPDSVEHEAIRQIDRSRNDISHVGFSIRWARENGHIVYRDSESK